MICTELGRKLVETFPIKDLFNLEFTGRLEKSLYDIEKGNFSKNEFLQLIQSFTTVSVEKIKEHQAGVIHEVSTPRKTNEVMGKCPMCGHAVIEGKERLWLQQLEKWL